MPAYTRYNIEVETVVRVSTQSGFAPGEFITTAYGIADSDQRPLHKGIVSTVKEAAERTDPFANAMFENEQKRRKDIPLV